MSAARWVLMMMGGGAVAAGCAGSKPVAVLSCPSGTVCLAEQGLTCGSESTETAEEPGGALGPAQVTPVVAKHSSKIRQKCWQPVSKAQQGALTIKVMVAATVDAEGKVISACVHGGDSPPKLVSCMADRIRKWEFPEAAGSTRLRIPFVFTTQ